MCDEDLKGEIRDLIIARRYEEALQLCEPLFLRCPDDTGVNMYMADIYEEQGRLGDALEHWGIIEKIRPGEAFVFFFRSQIQIALRRYKDAIADLDEALRLDDESYFTDAIHLYLAECWMQLGKFDKAQAECELVENERPLPGFRQEGIGNRQDVLRDVARKREEAGG